MRVSILLLSNPALTRSGELAVRFLEAANAAGMLLDTAFFYHSAAHAGLNADAPRQARWSKLADSAGLQCVVCRTALARAGCADLSCVDPFRLGGLADWLAACDRSDRVLTFRCH